MFHFDGLLLRGLRGCCLVFALCCLVRGLRRILRAVCCLVQTKRCFVVGMLFSSGIALHTSDFVLSSPHIPLRTLLYTKKDPGKRSLRYPDLLKVHY